MKQWMIPLIKITRHMRLRSKLFWIILSISLVPFITTVLLFNYYSHKTLEKEIGSHTIEIAKQVDQQLETFVEEMKRMSNIIHFNTDVQYFLTIKSLSYDAKELVAVLRVRELLADLGSLRGDIEGIFIINDHGVIAYNAKSRKVLDDDYLFEEHEWYKQLKNSNDFQLLPPHPQMYVKGDQVVTFAVRLTNIPGRSIGTLLVDLNPEFLSNKTKNLKLGNTGSVFMLTENGEPINNSDSVPASLLKNDSFQDSIKQQSGYFITRSDDDEKVLAAFSTSMATGWKIIGVVPFEELAEGIQQIRYLLIVLVTFFVIFIFVVSSYISKVITKPFKKLETSMEMVEKGDFTIRIPIKNRDEIGMLSKKFNHMLKQLQHLKEEIHWASIREYKLKLLSSESEIKALQAQINPHFLYNTLNTMTCIGEVYDIDDVVIMSESLAKMFKYSIEGEETTSLVHEINHVKAYLEIIRIRYRERFQFHIHIPEELNSCMLIKLMIQPLVENAIEHGLDIRKGEGNVWIHAISEDTSLILTVSDDGVGIPEHKRKWITQFLNPENEFKNENGKHIGLFNVQQRLWLHYGSEAKMTITSKMNKGTMVRIQLPLTIEGGNQDV